MAQETFYVEPVFTNGKKRNGIEYGVLSVDQSIMFKTSALTTGFEFIKSGFGTVVPDVPLNTAVPMYRESYNNGSSLKGAGETSPIDDYQGFNAQQTRRRKHSKLLRVRKISSEREFKESDLLGTWKKEVLGSEAMEARWKNPGMTAYFLNNVFNVGIRDQISNLMINGDRGCADKSLNQFDGILKHLAHASESRIKHKITYRLPVSAADDKFHLKVSGKPTVVAHATNEATTLTAIKTAINNVAYKGSQLYNATIITKDGVKYLAVESNDYKVDVDLKMAFSPSTKIDWRKFKGELTDDIEVVEEIMATGDTKPVTVNYLDLANIPGANIREKSQNVLDWFMEYSIALNYYNSLEGKSSDNAKTYISPSLDKWLRVALLQISRNSGGSAAEMRQEVFGSNLATHAKLHSGDTFTSYDGNLHIGTNLLDDIDKVDIGLNWELKKFMLRMSAAYGVALMLPQDFVTSVTSDTHSHFGPLDLYLDQFMDANRMDVPGWEVVAAANGWVNPNG